jgi:hypothetical protein
MMLSWVSLADHDTVGRRGQSADGAARTAVEKAPINPKTTAPRAALNIAFHIVFSSLSLMLFSQRE